MDNKTLSMLSYITIIGWLVAYFVNKEEANDLRKYHLEQGFGLFLSAIVLNVAASIIMRTSFSLGFLGSLVGLFILILAIMGIIAASKEEKKPLPLIGHLFEGKFNFLK